MYNIVYYDLKLVKKVLMLFLFLQNQQTILEISVISMSNIYQKVVVNCFKYECIYFFIFLYIY